MIELKDVREGSIVWVRGSFGNGPAVKAKVTCVETDIKHGYPGIDYTIIDTDADHWAYLNQVTQVEQY